MPSYSLIGWCQPTRPTDDDASRGTCEIAATHYSAHNSILRNRRGLVGGSSPAWIQELENKHCCFCLSLNKFCFFVFFKVGQYFYTRALAAGHLRIITQSYYLKRVNVWICLSAIYLSLKPAACFRRNQPCLCSEVQRFHYKPNKPF